MRHIREPLLRHVSLRAREVGLNFRYSLWRRRTVTRSTLCKFRSSSIFIVSVWGFCSDTHVPIRRFFCYRIKHLSLYITTAPRTSPSLESIRVPESIDLETTECPFSLPFYRQISGSPIPVWYSTPPVKRSCFPSNSYPLEFGTFCHSQVDKPLW